MRYLYVCSYVNYTFVYFNTNLINTYDYKIKYDSRIIFYSQEYNGIYLAFYKGKLSKPSDFFRYLRYLNSEFYYKK